MLKNLFVKVALKLLGMLSFLFHKGRNDYNTNNKCAKFLINELQENVAEISSSDHVSTSSSGSDWSDNLIHLRRQIITGDIEKFLTWRVIRKTMFVAYAPYIAMELKYLKSLPDWKNRWRPAIREASVGRPIPCLFYPRSSCNLIHQAYTIAKFEKNIGHSVGDMELIFEFGGGYGRMAGLIKRLGFKGTYIIFDLPEFSALQEYYLKSLGYGICHYELFGKGETNCIFCISDKTVLRSMLESSEDSILPDRRLFIANWSLSESPIHIREDILQMTKGFGKFIISYQELFEGINNIEYFSKWQKRRCDIEWKNWGIQHLPHNYYAFGSAACADKSHCNSGGF